MLLTILVNREYGTAFIDGRVIITGRLVIRVTNLDTTKSVVLNASGPGHIDRDGTFTAEGRYLAFGPTIDGLNLYTGHRDYFTAVGSGHVVSVCDMLAG
ncbi:MAG: hypothetical protein H0U37_07770 [Chloroflexi bacterium]|nr:hypothetical protein [Chloroflexota bacterium]